MTIGGWVELYIWRKHDDSSYNKLITFRFKSDSSMYTTYQYTYVLRLWWQQSRVPSKHLRPRVSRSIWKLWPSSDWAMANWRLRKVHHTSFTWPFNTDLLCHTPGTVQGIGNLTQPVWLTQFADGRAPPGRADRNSIIVWSKELNKFWHAREFAAGKKGFTFMTRIFYGITQNVF